MDSIALDTKNILTIKEPELHAMLSSALFLLRLMDIKSRVSFRAKKYSKQLRIMCVFLRAALWKVKNKEKNKIYVKKFYSSHKKEQKIRDARRYFKFPYKHRAKALLNHAVKKGKIIKPKECSSCGISASIEAHHPDYAFPLKVIWLCRNCHSFIHCVKGVRRKNAKRRTAPGLR